MKRTRGPNKDGLYTLTYCARVCGVGRYIVADLLAQGYLEPAGARENGDPLFRMDDMRTAHLEWKANAPTEDFCFVCLEWRPVGEVMNGACSMCRTPKRRARTLAEAEGT